MESNFQKFIDDDRVHVICSYTNEILKQGNTDLGEPETWSDHVIWLNSIQLSREFRALMAEERTRASWGLDWKPDDDDGSGDRPLSVPSPVPGGPNMTAPNRATIAA